MATSTPPAKRIKVVVQDPDEDVDPIVVSFPGGSSDTAVFEWRKPKPNSKRGHILQGRDDTCIYKASSSGRGFDGRRTKTCVGVLDKEKGVLNLYTAAEKGTLYALQQTVGGSNSNSSQLQEDIFNAMERRSILFDSFGSSKKRKVLKSQTANQVSVEAVIGGMGSAITSQMSGSNQRALTESKTGNKTDAVEAAYAEARRKFLPPFDENATHPRKVYDSRSMLTGKNKNRDAWDHLNRVVDVCIHQDDWAGALQARGVWFPCVQSLFTSLQQTQSTSPSKYRIRCAVALNWLLRFHAKCGNRTSLSGTVDELAKMTEVPQPSFALFLYIFSSPVASGNKKKPSYALTKQLKDKRCIYILILYLLAQGDMKVPDIQPLLRDSKIEAKDATILLREAGCTVQRASEGAISVALTVPLTFPPPNRGRA